MNKQRMLKLRRSVAARRQFDYRHACRCVIPSMERALGLIVCYHKHGAVGYIGVADKLGLSYAEVAYIAAELDGRAVEASAPLHIEMDATTATGRAGVREALRRIDRVIASHQPRALGPDATEQK